jgi:hypothetical protein
VSKHVLTGVSQNDNSIKFSIEGGNSKIVDLNRIMFIEGRVVHTYKDFQSFVVTYYKDLAEKLKTQVATAMQGNPAIEGHGLLIFAYEDVNKFSLYIITPKLDLIKNGKGDAEIDIIKKGVTNKFFDELKADTKPWSWQDYTTKEHLKLFYQSPSTTTNSNNSFFVSFQDNGFIINTKDTTMTETVSHSFIYRDLYDCNGIWGDSLKTLVKNNSECCVAYNRDLDGKPIKDTFCSTYDEPTSCKIDIRLFNNFSFKRCIAKGMEDIKLLLTKGGDLAALINGLTDLEKIRYQAILNALLNKKIIDAILNDPRDPFGLKAVAGEIKDKIKSLRDAISKNLELRGIDVGKTLGNTGIQDMDKLIDEIVNKFGKNDPTINNGVSNIGRNNTKPSVGGSANSQPNSITVSTGAQGASATGAQGTSGPGSQGASAAGAQGASATGAQGTSGPGSQGASAAGAQGTSGTGSQGASAIGAQVASGTGSQGTSGTIDHGTSGSVIPGSSGIAAQGSSGIGAAQGSSGITAAQGSSAQGASGTLQSGSGLTPVTAVQGASGNGNIQGSSGAGIQDSQGLSTNSKSIPSDPEDKDMPLTDEEKKEVTKLAKELIKRLQKNVTTNLTEQDVKNIIKMIAKIFCTISSTIEHCLDEYLPTHLFLGEDIPKLRKIKAIMTPLLEKVSCNCIIKDKVELSKDHKSEDDGTKFEDLVNDAIMNSLPTASDGEPVKPQDPSQHVTDPANQTNPDGSHDPNGVKPSEAETNPFEKKPEEHKDNQNDPTKVDSSGCTAGMKIKEIAEKVTQADQGINSV